MNLKVLKETESPLLKRKRLTLEIEHVGSATPSRQSLKEDLCKQYNVLQENIAIRHIFTKFGMNKSKIIAHIYEDSNNLKFLEPPKGKKSEPKKKAASK
ncbi:MAG TPA: hypothetical protein VJG30_02235 [Candidatus Nanoarchaeia archaeon]|nr:hypothetical protein [Candidatus Nanoarchaeia archaeon]